MITTVDRVYRRAKEVLGRRRKNGHSREVVEVWMYYVVFRTETHVPCCELSPPCVVILSRCAISKEAFEKFVAAGARNSGDVVRP